MTKEAQKQMEQKAKLYRKLDQKAKEIEAQMKALQADLISVLDAEGVTKLTAGLFTVSYTEYVQNRFDSTRFKTEHADIYELYKRPVNQHSFKVS